MISLYTNTYIDKATVPVELAGITDWLAINEHRPLHSKTRQCGFKWIFHKS